MAIQTALWRVGSKPERLVGASLAKEAVLETMIMSAPEVLSEEWLLIGQQEDTGLGGRVDLLAITPDASLVLIELKRDRTPREVVAQSLDYASWLETLTSDKIGAIYSRFRPGGNLAVAFKTRYGIDLAEDTLNQSHQIVIVASSMDASTERIVNYLSARDIPINVLLFQVFAFGNEQILSRTWLVDPVETQVNVVGTTSSANEPWNGEFYCSFGEDTERSWTDAIRYGFISAGGGTWYTKTLNLLSPGDRVWTKIPGKGFVGVGIVTGKVQASRDYTIETDAGPKLLFDLQREGNYLKALADDPEMSEYLVPVKWLDTVTATHAFNEVGLFGNQNSVCQPTTPKWRYTVDRLKTAFPRFDRRSAEA